jgi:integrase
MTQRTVISMSKEQRSRTRASKRAHGAGQLIWRKSGWYARVRTNVEGERIRVCRALGTQNKAVAKRRLEKLLAADNPKAEDIARPETFSEAAERVYAAKLAVRPDWSKEGLSWLRRYAVPTIGAMPASAVKPSDVHEVLMHCRSEQLSLASTRHVRQHMANVFRQLRAEGEIVASPTDDAVMPDFATTVVRERAVLTDSELAVYLAWENPEERFQGAVRERQTMACVARMFGGLRTGDLHALRWDAFETEAGAFTWGYAPRQKTRRPQLLEVPAMLRPMLRDHWERAGRPTEGLVFPVRKAGKRGQRVGLQRLGVSHASAFRRDLERAFLAATERGDESAPAKGSARWRELFTETEYTLPVDFHSWRRAFAQALADADLNAQRSMALTGHASLAAHARYLRSAGKLQKLPEAALPALTVYPDREAENWALDVGQGAHSTVESAEQKGSCLPEKSGYFARPGSSGRSFNPTVDGSIPSRPTLRDSVPII